MRSQIRSRVKYLIPPYLIPTHVSFTFKFDMRKFNLIGNLMLTIGSGLLFLGHRVHEAQ